MTGHVETHALFCLLIVYDVGRAPKCLLLAFCVNSNMEFTKKTTLKIQL